MNSLEQAYDLTSDYKPVALYFREADLVEYVREDACCVYKRIDEILTLALEMDTRLPIGFRLKGFRNLFLKATADDKSGRTERTFVGLIEVIERAACAAGNEVFEQGKRIGYQCAADIARSDDVKLSIPEWAA